MAPRDDPAPSELEQRATTVVLLGRFNPEIFQPMWFAARGLLAEEDVQPETIVLTNGFSAFSTQDMSLFCARDRLQLGTTPKTPTPDILRDVITETFKLLSETPIGQLGLNHQVHVPKAQQTWDTVVALFGDPQRRLVLLENQELQTVEIRSPRDDRFIGFRTIYLQPSAALAGGVWFQLNDHVQLADPPERAIGAANAMAALTEIWDSSQQLGQQVHRQIAPGA